METGYPFVAIVVNRESGHYESIQTLEREGASQEILNAIVHGPFSLAVELVEEWRPELGLVQNTAIVYED